MSNERNNLDIDEYTKKRLLTLRSGASCEKTRKINVYWLYRLGYTIGSPQLADFGVETTDQLELIIEDVERMLKNGTVWGKEHA